MVLASGFAFLFNVSLTVIFHELFGIDETVAFGLAIVVVVFGNYFVARLFVFNEIRSERNASLYEFGLFVLSVGVFRVIEIISFEILQNWLDVGYINLLFVVLSVSFILKYLFFKNIFFRVRRIDGGRL